MKKAIYVCDKCGKVLDLDKDYSEIEIDCCDFQEEEDLCLDCYTKLTKVVEEFFRSK